MKKFTEIKKIRRFNEADEVKPNLPSNYEEMSKEELLGLLSGSSKEKQPEPVSKEDNEVSTSDSSPAQFFSKLFESREMAHIYHLQVNGEMGSHAKHTALGEYYEGILGFIDDLIEIYQGQYDIIENYDVIDTSATNTKDTVEYFRELADFIKVERKCIKAEDTHMHNVIDEVIALIYKTLYKLRFNK